MEENATEPEQVLIVEDDRPLAHALELKLRNEGFTTATAFDGRQALDMLRDQQFEVLLLDLMLPVVDGFEILKQLQDLPRKPGSVLVLSSLGRQEDEDRALSLGAKKFFAKSDTSLSTIVAEVKNALRRVRGGEAHND